MVKKMVRAKTRPPRHEPLRTAESGLLSPALSSNGGEGEGDSCNSSFRGFNARNVSGSSQSVFHPSLRLSCGWRDPWALGVGIQIRKACCTVETVVGRPCGVVAVSGECDAAFRTKLEDAFAGVAEGLATFVAAWQRTLPGGKQRWSGCTATQAMLFDRLSGRCVWSLGSSV